MPSSVYKTFLESEGRKNLEKIIFTSTFVSQLSAIGMRNFKAQFIQVIVKTKIRETHAINIHES